MQATPWTSRWRQTWQQEPQAAESLLRWRARGAHPLLWRRRRLQVGSHVRGSTREGGVGAGRSLSPPSSPSWSLAGLSRGTRALPALSLPRPEARAELMVCCIALPLPTSQRLHEDVRMEAGPASPEAAPGHVAVCGPCSSRSRTSSNACVMLVEGLKPASSCRQSGASGECPALMSRL